VTRIGDVSPWRCGQDLGFVSRWLLVARVAIDEFAPSGCGAGGRPVRCTRGLFMVKGRHLQGYFRTREPVILDSCIFLKLTSILTLQYNFLSLQCICVSISLTHFYLHQSFQFSLILVPKLE
jgi:hypothetical protein